MIKTTKKALSLEVSISNLIISLLFKPALYQRPEIYRHSTLFVATYLTVNNSRHYKRNMFRS
jgi:hypothetical protein